MLNYGLLHCVLLIFSTFYFISLSLSLFLSLSLLMFCCCYWCCRCCPCCLCPCPCRCFVPVVDVVLVVVGVVVVVVFYAVYGKRAGFTKWKWKWKWKSPLLKKRGPFTKFTGRQIEIQRNHSNTVNNLPKTWFAKSPNTYLECRWRNTPIRSQSKLLGIGCQTCIRSNIINQLSIISWLQQSKRAT